MIRRRSLGRDVARTAILAKTATRVAGNERARQEAAQAHAQVAAADAAAAQASAAHAQIAAAQATAMLTGDATPPAVSTADRLTQLATLGQLHTSGVLTDEEFAAEKARILAS